MYSILFRIMLVETKKAVSKYSIIKHICTTFKAKWTFSFKLLIFHNFLYCAYFHHQCTETDTASHMGKVVVTNVAHFSKLLLISLYVQTYNSLRLIKLLPGLHFIHWNFLPKIHTLGDTDRQSCNSWLWFCMFWIYFNLTTNDYGRKIFPKKIYFFGF